MNRIGSLYFISICGLSVLSFAANAKESYDVVIPKSRIEMPKLSEPAARGVPDQLELGASTWAPSGFSLPTHVSGATDFSRAGLPSLYFNYLKPMSALDGLYLKAGLNWISLNRDGKIGNESSVATETQTLSLASARIGAEYAPAVLQLAAAQPYLGLALLPSLGMTGRSAFDDGSAYFGVPLEYAIGAQFELRRFGLNWNQARLDLGLTGTAGTIDHSSVAGIGVKGGIRVAL